MAGWLSGGRGGRAEEDRSRSACSGDQQKPAAGRPDHNQLMEYAASQLEKHHTHTHTVGQEDKQKGKAHEREGGEGERGTEKSE